LRIVLQDIIPYCKSEYQNVFIDRVCFYQNDKKAILYIAEEETMTEHDIKAIEEDFCSYFFGFLVEVKAAISGEIDIPSAVEIGEMGSLSKQSELNEPCPSDDADVSLPDEKFIEEEPYFETIDEKIAKKTQAIRDSVRETAANTSSEKKSSETDGTLYGRPFKDEPITLEELSVELGMICVEGEIFKKDSRELKSGKILIMLYITDRKTSISVKMFAAKKQADEAMEKIKEGMCVRVKGRITYDTFAKENVIMANSIIPAKKVMREDHALKKRVELHAHTVMSNMDAVVQAGDLVKTAARFGHPAIAITDHGVVQSFPDAMKAAKGGNTKVIYGVEGYLVDEEKAQCVHNLSEKREIENCEFVVFDLETTGLNPYSCNITEIGAVKVKNGNILDTWSSFVNPEMPIPPKITELTSITDDMVKDAPTMAKALPEFFEFCRGAILVAHNTSFDCNFLKVKCKDLGMAFDFAYLDTLALARNLYPTLKNYKLNTLTKHLKVVLQNHHRAVDDAMATARIFIIMMDELKSREVTELMAVNRSVLSKEAIIKQPRRHVIILVKTQAGMKNLYKLVSLSHLNYFYRKPIIPKSLLMEHRDGLIIGSACEQGELYQAILGGKSDEEIKKICSFYDYLEIQPLGNNQFMIDNGNVSGKKALENINREIIALGKETRKPVVATCDVHFLNPEDEIYRRILMAGQGFSDADNQAPLFLRTTDEMLEEFSYLGEDLANEVVITNTNLIADMIEDGITPISREKCPPEIEGSDKDIMDMTMTKAKSIYGDMLPKIVQDRIDKELNSIIKNGFAVMYMIAHKLVKKSLDDGYLVGSRGSVGSSLVAFLTDITEVNSLPAHYVCPHCHYSEFPDETGSMSGCDMPDKECPKCGTMLKKDGHDIPFETFLGFDGDKEPDIDLNFSGDYQSVAHKYTEELFGAGQTFRAGTIGTIAEKTAYGYILHYFEEKGITVPKAEMERLVMGCTGVRRTTGQHPGGIVVVPHGREIYEFCPVQHPADDNNTDIITTHFDYHSIDKNLLKLDILGHDDPTVIRMLEDLTGTDAKMIEIGEKETMSLFTSTKALGVTSQEIDSETGTFGVPEFGTGFVRQMLVETKPKTFSELVRISGLSHGTDVWTNNAQELVKNKTTDLKGAICTRDDIMLYLISMGLDPKLSFTIMEAVRKGKGLKPDDEEEMQKHNVPKWYIDSCNKIKYMFPKAHAVAYVTMAFRIAYYKVHHPKEFYATYFSIRADDFDFETMGQGKQKALDTLVMFRKKQEESSLTAKEKGSVTILQMANEMYCRHINFLPIDLYESDATHFMVKEDGILPPLNSIGGLGDNAAKSICEARCEKEFFSKDELLARTKLTKTSLEILEKCGCLEGMSQSSQISFF